MTAGIAEYFAMGGYAGFVWPANAVALAVLGGLELYSWHRYRASCTALERLQRPAGTQE